MNKQNGTMSSHVKTREAEVTQVLREEGSEMRRKEILDRVEMSGSRLDNVLDNLIESGTVTRVRHGFYDLTERVKAEGVGNPPTEEKFDDPVTEEYTSIPLLSINARGSAESDVWELQVDRYMTVQRQTLQTESGADPEQMGVLTVTGDSMEGTLSPGDKVLVVRTDGESIVEGVVYIWRSQHRGIIVKRAHWRDSETLELISDNDRYDPIVIHKDGEATWDCLGRVVRVMRAV